MKLLASLKAKDVDLNALDFDYNSFKLRKAARAIIFDEDGRVALIHVSKHDYYMLPGGGIENGEDARNGLNREITEELGCKIEIISEIGRAEVYFDRWSKKQVDYCYTARVIGSDNNKNLTSFESEEGHSVIWAHNIHDAAKLVAKAKPENLDGKLVKARDLVFLEATLAIITQLPLF